MKKLIIFVLFLNVCVFSQSTNELFESGNTFYKDAKYDQAIDAYKRILNSGETSSELYHNLGNCYYKLNQVASSVYYYEKALQLNPNNTDARNNLVFANKLTLDRIEALPKSFSEQFREAITSKLSYDGWAISAVVLSFITAGLFVLFYLSQISSRKRLFFVGSIVGVLLLIVSLVFAFTEYDYQSNHTQAIVFASEVPVKSEPTQGADISFKLHEGTKVVVTDGVDNWKKIQLINGKIGWVLADTLKEL